MKFIDSRSGAKQTITESKLIDDAANCFKKGGYIEGEDFWVNTSYGEELYFSFHEELAGSKEEMEEEAVGLQEHLYQLHGMKTDLKTCGKMSFRLVVRLID